MPLEKKITKCQTVYKEFVTLVLGLVNVSNIKGAYPVNISKLI